MSSETFCAFHPKRVIVPSLPFLFATPEIVRPETEIFARPRIPSWLFWVAFAARLARIVESSICSIRPAPNTGVGVRKITLLFLRCVAKSGWAM